MGEVTNGSAPPETREPPEARGPPESPASPESIDLARILERATSHLDGLVGDLKILGSVRSDRLRERLSKTLGGAQRAIVWGLAIAGLAVAGIVVLAIGVFRAFEALFDDRPGLGGIAAGVSLIVAAVVLSTVRSAQAHRAHVRRLEEKYAGMESGSRSGASTP